MKRTPMSRGSGSGLSRSAPMKRTKPLRQRSKKKAKQYAGDAGRAELVRRFLAKHPRCEVGALLWPAGPKVRIRGAERDRLIRGGHWVWACSGKTEHVHERLRRSQGGSLFDEDNLVAVCPLCHDRVHCFPAVAVEIGLLIHSTPKENAHV